MLTTGLIYLRQVVLPLYNNIVFFSFKFSQVVAIFLVSHVRNSNDRFLFTTVFYYYITRL